MKLISRIVAILMLCAAAPLFGAINLVAHASAACSNGCPGAVTTPAIDTTGANLIVIATSIGSGSTLIRDSNSNTWTALTRYGAGPGIQLFYCFGPAVGSGHTFSNGSGDYPAIAVAAYSGVASAPFDTQNGVANVSSPIHTGSITPGSNGELLISALGDLSGTTVSIDSSFALIEQQFYSPGSAYGVALAWQVQATAAPINPTWTTSFGSATIAAFRAAASGGGVQLISSGTAAMSTAAISSGACTPPVTASASGVALTDAIIYNTNTNPTTVTGYAPSANGSLYILAFPSANNVNFVVCNPSSSSITPGALALNWQVMR
jgi:hypothetical protein